MRKLTLRKETLVLLSVDELGNVVGAAQTRDCGVTNFACPTDPCITPPPYTGLKCLLTEGCA